MAAPDIDPSDAKLIAQAKAAAAARKAEAATQTSATQAALTRLTSGATLTNAERALLNMSPVPTPAAKPAPGLSSEMAAGDAYGAAGDAQALEAAAEAARIKAEQDIANAKTADEIAKANAARVKAEQEATAAKAALTAANSANTIAAQQKAAADALAKQQARDNTITVMRARFKQYGLETLAAKIEQLAVDGASEATITIQLQETPEYQARFKANAVRLKNNLAVLTPAEYLTTEDTYRQVLRSYGLKQFDTDEYVSQFLANDVSPTELTQRVQTAVQRVQNADPAVSKTLRDYYGIGQADLVAYVLDPATQFEKVKRQVAAAEVGTAARIQGLETGVGVAEQLAAQGVTQAEAQKGYATIADILPTAEKLSAIYGTTLEGYDQSSAEQEVFNSLASAQRARQKLTAREIAQFSGASGASRASLSQQKSGQY